MIMKASLYHSITACMVNVMKIQYSFICQYLENSSLIASINLHIAWGLIKLFYFPSHVYPTQLIHIPI